MLIGIDGASIGQHPLVTRLLKGAFQTRPPMPRYWDVSMVLSYLDNQSVDETLSLKLLSQRTLMLLALSRPSRSADLSNLDLRGYRNTPEGAVFQPTVLSKQSRPGRPLGEIMSCVFLGIIYKEDSFSTWGLHSAVHLLHQASSSCYFFYNCKMVKGNHRGSWY